MGESLSPPLPHRNADSAGLSAFGFQRVAVTSDKQQQKGKARESG